MVSLHDSQVLLISYEMLRTRIEAINETDWAVIVFDEIHRLKNDRSKLTVACKELRCLRRVGLTGTIMQNNFAELYCLIDFVRPGFLNSYSYFKRTFVDKIETGQQFSAQLKQVARTRNAQRMLNLKLKHVMIRRTKEIIANELPGKQENIVFCPLTESEQRVYDRALNTPEIRTLRQATRYCTCGSGKLIGNCHWNGPKINVKKEILRIISRMNHLCNHPVLIEVQQDDDDEKQQRDALFRKQVLGDDVDLVERAMRSHEHHLISGKMRVLQSLLKDWLSDPESRILIFSRSTRILSMLQQFLEKIAVKALRIDGSVAHADRTRMVNQFQAKTNRVPVFLVSTLAGGLGLNLTAANIVVVFDPNWNQTHDLQAQDRAYRIGQTRFTRIFRFISSGTIEELIYLRQIYKQQFANIAQENSNERRYFDHKELFGIPVLLCDVAEMSRTSLLMRRYMGGTDAEFEAKTRIQPNQPFAGLLGIGENSNVNDNDNASSAIERNFRIEVASETKAGSDVPFDDFNAEVSSTSTTTTTAPSLPNSKRQTAATDDDEMLGGPSEMNKTLAAVLDEKVDLNQTTIDELREFEQSSSTQQISRANSGSDQNHQLDERTKQLLQNAGVKYHHSHLGVVGNSREEEQLTRQSTVLESGIVGQDTLAAIVGSQALPDASDRPPGKASLSSGSSRKSSKRSRRSQYPTGEFEPQASQFLGEFYNSLTTNDPTPASGSMVARLSSMQQIQSRPLSSSSSSFSSLPPSSSSPASSRFNSLTSTTTSTSMSKLYAYNSSNNNNAKPNSLLSNSSSSFSNITNINNVGSVSSMNYNKFNAAMNYNKPPTTSMYTQLNSFMPTSTSATPTTTSNSNVVKFEQLSFKQQRLVVHWRSLLVQRGFLETDIENALEKTSFRSMDDAVKYLLNNNLNEAMAQYWPQSSTDFSLMRKQLIEMGFDKTRIDDALSRSTSNTSLDAVLDTLSTNTSINNNNADSTISTTIKFEDDDINIDRASKIPKSATMQFTDAQRRAQDQIERQKHQPFLPQLNHHNFQHQQHNSNRRRQDDAEDNSGDKIGNSEDDTADEKPHQRTTTTTTTTTNNTFIVAMNSNWNNNNSSGNNNSAESKKNVDAAKMSSDDDTLSPPHEDDNNIGSTANNDIVKQHATIDRDRKRTRAETMFDSDNNDNNNDDNDASRSIVNELTAFSANGVVGAEGAFDPSKLERLNIDDDDYNKQRRRQQDNTSPIILAVGDNNNAINNKKRDGNPVVLVIDDD